MRVSSAFLLVCALAAVAVARQPAAEQAIARVGDWDVMPSGELDVWQAAEAEKALADVEATSNVRPGGRTLLQSKSWGERLMDSLMAVLAGIVLLVLSCCATFWNEQHYVKRRSALSRSISQLVQDHNADLVDRENDGKFLHVHGDLTTVEELNDAATGCSVVETLRLRRVVEIQQYREKKHTRQRKQFGGGTQTEVYYTFELEWASGPLVLPHGDGVHINHHPDWDWAGHCKAQWNCRAPTLGKYAFPMETMEERMTDYLPLPWPADYQEKMDGYLAGKDFVHERDDGFLYMYMTGPGGERLPTGTVRIRMEAVPAQPVTLISQQVPRGMRFLGLDNEAPEEDFPATFRPLDTAAPAGSFPRVAPVPKTEEKTLFRTLSETYKKLNQHQHTKTNEVELFETGLLNWDEMYNMEYKNGNKWLWIIRFALLIVNWVCVLMILSPIGVLADVIPFLGDIVGFMLAVIAFFVGLAITLVVTAIAWLFYRPFMSMLLLAVGSLPWTGPYLMEQYGGYKPNKSKTA